MKLNQLYIVAISLLLGFSSCSDEFQQESNVQQAVEITGAVGDASTRVSGTAWEDGDKIGVTLFNYNSSNLNLPSSYNRQYTTKSGELGHFKPTTLNETLFYPLGQEVSLAAYYPNQAGIDRTLKVPINVADQSNLGKLDFIVGYSAGPYSLNNTTISMSFKRKMSMLRFRFAVTSDSDKAKLTGATITMTGMYTAGNYNITNSDADNMSELSTISDITLNIDGTTLQAEAIVFPRAAGDGITFTITFNDNSTQLFYMPSDHALRSGYRRTYTFSGSENITMVGSALEPWTDKGDFGNTWE